MKMMKIREERTLDNGPYNKTCLLCERKFTNNFNHREHLKFKHPDAFAKEINKN